MLLDEKLKYLFQHEPSKCLYHYTGMDGFLGILSTRSVWASEARFLNDTAEVAHFFSSLVGQIKINNHHEGPKRDLFQQFQEWTKIRNHSRSGGSPSLFLASFSEDGDLLSQWRGYCPNGGGVSLGFMPNSITQTAKMNGAMLGRCIYKKENLEDVATTILDIISNEAQESATSHPSQSYHESFASMELSLLKIAALFKHSAYEDEQEWRLIVEPDNQHPSPGTKFRNRSGILVPYKELSINGGKHDELFIDEVVVGPSQSIEDNFDSVCQAYRTYKKGRTPVSNSRIPYRGI